MELLEPGGLDHPHALRHQCWCGASRVDSLTFLQPRRFHHVFQEYRFGTFPTAGGHCRLHL
jgi:hypothetical protein